MKLGQAFAIPANLIPIIWMVFLLTMGWGMVVPFLPLVAESVGGKASDAGVLLASFATARLAFGIPAGAASDRFGRRTLMLVGVVLFTSGAFGAVASGSVVTVALAVFVMGAGSACYVTAALAAVADLSDGGGRGRLMSYYQSGVLGGISVGPVVGGMMVYSFDVHGPFVLQGILVAIGGSLGVLVLKETRRPGLPAAVEAAGFAARVRVLASPALLAVCALAFSIYASRVVATLQVVPVFARTEFGYDPRMTGVLLTTGALANLLCLPLAAISIERLGAYASIIISGTAVLAGLVLVCVPGSVVALWGAVLVLGAAGSTMATACAAFAAGASAAAHGLKMGSLRMSGDVGLVVGPLLVAGLNDHLHMGLRTTVAIMAAGMAAMLVGFTLAGRAQGGKTPA